MSTIHGTCLDIAGFGVLLRGPSGFGKSDLALRLLDITERSRARLVADDRVCLATDHDQLIASAPPVLLGLLEVRGLGLMKMPVSETVVLGLVIDLVKTGEVERLPRFPEDRIMIRDVELPRLHLCAFEASATAKVHMAVSLLR